MLKLNHKYPFLFTNFFNESDYLQKYNSNTLPSVNVKEKSDSFSLELAAPGLKKEDFKISFQNNKLSISADKTEKQEESEEKYTRKEFSYETFQRIFTLPTSVDGESISANYSEGILNISIPKKEEAKAKEAQSIVVA
jgi:HSP20 family protein